MIEFLGDLQDSVLAQNLRHSQWTYPAINAAHILGLALLVGSILPMDLRLTGLRRLSTPHEVVAILRPVAATGLALAVITGSLLFIVQARDYTALPVFWLKVTLVLLATSNALIHSLRPIDSYPRYRQIIAGTLSLILWPTALLTGRLIGYF